MEADIDPVATPEWFRPSAIVDFAPVSVWVCDAEGQCIFLNQTWTRFTGQPSAEGLGWGFLQAIHPDDGSSVVAAWHAARASLRPYQSEYRLKSQDGSYHWVIDSAAPQFADDGTLLGYVGAITDNSERKAAEQAKLQSDRRLQIAVQATGLGIWEWDLPTNRFFLSPIARAMFGFSSGEIFSFDTVERLLHPDDIAQVRAMSAAALDPAIRASAPYRYRIIRNDGEVRWIHAEGAALFETVDGTVRATSYIGTFQDVTDRVEANARVLESEERLRLAIDAGGIAVWELNAVTNEVTRSPELNRLYGFPDDATPTIADLQSRYAPGEKERLSVLAQEAMAHGQSELATEVHHILPGGVARWFYLRAKLAAPGPRSQRRVIGVVMDVTERKLGEERLMVVARELQHRVKNSVAVIQSIAKQTFKGGRADPDALAAFTGRLQSLAAATDLLTRDDWVSTAVATLFEAVLAPYGNSTTDRIELVGDPAVRVPPKVATGLAMAAHELATNAAKYGSLSWDTGRVTLHWQLSAGTLRLRWTERDGPPVPAERTPGFGTRLLERGLFTGSAERATLTFAPTGLVAEFDIALGPEEIAQLPD
ncbi:MAG TPA: PAS domain-containing protein [Devosia sp.]|nr:PAS domain-containing protein [Devosia sp.]